MATKAPTPKPTAIGVTVYNGQRQPFTGKFDLRLIDGSQNLLLRKTFNTPGVNLAVPFHNNFADNYTVFVNAKNCRDTGFTPVKAMSGASVPLDLMLLPSDAVFNFRNAQPDRIKDTHPELLKLLQTRPGGAYIEVAEQPGGAPILACLLNLLTAMRDIHLPSQRPIDYLRQIIWDDSLAQDRFYAWADKALDDQVKVATAQGAFAPEVGSQLFHKGSTSSYKQVQFGEANVQITFHANDKPPAGLSDCVKVEIDVDYFRDQLAHTVLEVIPNTLGRLVGHNGLTDPAAVYALRWIAGRHAGVPEFNPPYTIEAA